MHKRLFKKFKNYEEVNKFFQEEIKDEKSLEIISKVILEDEDSSFGLVEEDSRIRFIKFYRSGSCELCYEEYVDETKTKLESWKQKAPDFRDNSLRLEIIFEVREK
ncbi:hypothetical protein [Marinitoga sp. 38H-ov]|uniref:hypothetical protein n=1 Tax=Marinitoga sp. 38H-ov TaxID=1755814 RepID=UPI0013EB49FE|nr:hypothetical protein [Marinitoga sp. 38H-ov]KAF2956778.1 hypothetical protein AS160_04225 [Marinitoga sp. 38H-ov]